MNIFYLYKVNARTNKHEQLNSEYNLMTIKQKALKEEQNIKDDEYLEIKDSFNKCYTDNGFALV